MFLRWKVSGDEVIRAEIAAQKMPNGRFSSCILPHDYDLFGRIEEADALDEALKIIPGVIENGLFLGIADLAIIAGPGGVEVLEAKFGD